MSRMDGKKTHTHTLVKLEKRGGECTNICYSDGGNCTGFGLRIRGETKRSPIADIFQHDPESTSCECVVANFLEGFAVLLTVHYYIYYIISNLRWNRDP